MTIKQDLNATVASLISALATRAELFMLELSEEKHRFLKVIVSFMLFCAFLFITVSVFIVFFVMIVWESPYRLWWIGGAFVFFVLATYLTYIKIKSLILSQMLFADSVAAIKDDAEMIRYGMAQQKETEEFNGPN